MTGISGVSGAKQTAVTSRVVPLLLVAPIVSIILLGILFLIVRPLMPENIPIHVGPDGVGSGSGGLLIAIACGIAAVVFAIGGATTKEFFKDDHWFQTEKSIAVGIMSLGYGLIGFAVATILSTVGDTTGSDSSISVGMGMLGFLLTFIAAVCIYIVAFPRAKMTPLG
ncbi:hypothetical protein CVS30_06740 [Arthrobacter psychrolactophilus]|uniref:DUF1648 domain-containing protein n=1 Tax=Arthrobacter psychrolactophilus TaxID=92442 RepID=A0A2V5IR53_9MICC|nr:hypothetical protein [Arthrobacter psychrolactophilus]PYI39005.1 hypothetical protein CVS30_06740 [Arthrobacter psychrolactophilus]